MTPLAVARVLLADADDMGSVHTTPPVHIGKPKQDGHSGRLASHSCALALLRLAEADLDRCQAQVRDAYRRMTELRERVDGLEADSGEAN